MGKCDVCGSNEKTRVISGVNWCERCFSQLQKLRNKDISALDYFSSDEIKTSISPIAQKYIDGVNEQIIQKYQQEVERIEKFNALKKAMLVTTGYNFEGYQITAYMGIISGEVALGTGFVSEFAADFTDFLGLESDGFSNKLEQAKAAAYDRLITKAIEKGGNALIGVDFDYITFSRNIIGVSVNATLVIVEKYNSK